MNRILTSFLISASKCHMEMSKRASLPPPPLLVRPLLTISMGPDPEIILKPKTRETFKSTIHRHHSSKNLENYMKTQLNKCKCGNFENLSYFSWFIWYFSISILFVFNTVLLLLFVFMEIPVSLVFWPKSLGAGSC